MATHFRVIVSIIVAVLCIAGSAQAKYIGGVQPICTTCANGNRPPNAPFNAPSGTATSLSEGNFTEFYAGPRIKSSNGETIRFDLSYDSYNADGSHARIKNRAGVGVSDTYNVFLFRQREAMFRWDGNGRVTKYVPTSSTKYVSTAGYFETLERTPTGFVLIYKDQTRYEFAPVAGSPTFEGQQVFWLQKISHPRGTQTTLTYAGGLLREIANTFGLKFLLAYNPARMLESVTDPRGKTWTLRYDSTNTRLVGVDDQEGGSVAYTYNTLFQVTQKSDRDDRVFRFGYLVDKPLSTVDGKGAKLFSQTNSTKWATDATALANTLMRVYVPSTTSRTDGRGNVWQYDYDEGGYITRMRAPDGAETHYTYDPATLQLATVTDANGHQTKYEYDGLGNRLRKTDARNHVTEYTYDPVFNQLTSITDPNGRVTTYEIDPANGNRLKETRDDGGNNATREWTYDAHGNVLTETDENGNRTEHEYDAFGNRVKTTDAVGKPEQRQTSYTYDEVGNLTSRTDDNLHTTSYEYDALNRLILETDPRGKFTQYFYDGEGNRTKVIDRNLNATSQEFDHRRRLLRILDALRPPLNNVTSFTYDGNDNRKSATDKNLHTTKFDYDVQNRLVKTTDAELNVSRRTYDPVGNVLTETDANVHTTTYTYDELNRRKTMLDAEGNLTQYGHEGDVVCLAIGCPTRGSDLLSRQIDANGKFTYFKYDGLDRLTTEVRKQTDTTDGIDDDDGVTAYTYDVRGNRLTQSIRITEFGTLTTAYEYDPLHRLRTETNAAGEPTKYQYDGVDNLIRLTAPNLNITTYKYDALDRLETITDSVGPVASYTYDDEGNRKTAKDGNGNGSTYEYDPVYRATHVIDTLGRTTHYDYDAVGNLLAVTDREGNITRYDYDRINRRVKATDAQPFVIEYKYDRVGNLKEIRAFNDTEDPVDPPQVTRYEYDRINRLVTETYPDPAPNTRRFTYDGVGNILTRTDQKAQITRYTYTDLYFLGLRDYPVGGDDTMRYDLAGRMLEACRRGPIDDVPGDGCAGWLVTFAYDGANRVLQTAQNGQSLSYAYNIPGRTRTLTYPGGRTIVETTDARSRLDTIANGASSPLVRYQYDLGNRVEKRAHSNGVVAAYSYNSNNWITLLEHRRADTSLVAGFGHAYDNEGNKRFERKDHDPVRSEAYAYDKIYRLVEFRLGELVGSTVAVPTTQNQYDLDQVGNWKSKTTNGAPEDRDHNAANEITAIAGVPLRHDDNGNLSEDERYRYGYNEENRLIGVVRKADDRLVGLYEYDALSRRVSKVADAAMPSSNPVETRYFHDDERIVEEQDEAGTTLATYVYGNYIDEVLTMNRAGATYHYQPQTLWSVVAVTDAAGTVIERYTYDTYGLPRITDGTGVPLPANPWGTPRSAIGNPWMFTGRGFDEETGIYFFRSRHFVSVKGRFLQRDPIGYVDGMNLYQYVSGNPTNWMDPLGAATVVGGIEDDVAFRLRVELKITEFTDEKGMACCQGECNDTEEITSKSIQSFRSHLEVSGELKVPLGGGEAGAKYGVEALKELTHVFSKVKRLEEYRKENRKCFKCRFDFVSGQTRNVTKNEKGELFLAAKYKLVDGKIRASGSVEWQSGIQQSRTGWITLDGCCEQNALVGDFKREIRYAGFAAPENEFELLGQDRWLPLNGGRDFRYLAKLLP